MNRSFELPALVSCVGQYYEPYPYCGIRAPSAPADVRQVMGECWEAYGFSICEEYTNIGDTDECGHFHTGSDGQCYMYPACAPRNPLIVYPCQ